MFTAMTIANLHETESFCTLENKIVNQRDVWVGMKKFIQL